MNTVLLHVYQNGIAFLFLVAATKVARVIQCSGMAVEPWLLMHGELVHRYPCNQLPYFRPFYSKNLFCFISKTQITKQDIV